MKPDHRHLALAFLIAWLCGPPAVARAQPTVDSSRPASVELEAGGTAATVDLAGRDLHLVDGILVRLDGREFPPVAARLGDAARDGSSRQVVLQAERDAPAAGRLELVLFASRETRDPIPVPLGLSVAVPAPTLETVTVTPAELASGESASLTVSLDGPAPSTGVAIELKSDDPVAALPNDVQVNPGETEATVQLTAGETDSPRSVTLLATYEGVERSVALDVVPVPPALSGIEVKTAAYVAGGPVPARVHLDRADAMDVSVTLSASDPAAEPPAKVVIPQGSTYIDVEIKANPVESPTPVTLVASLRDVVRSTSFTLEPEPEPEPEPDPEPDGPVAWPVAVTAGQFQFTPQPAPVTDFTPVAVSIGAFEFTPEPAPEADFTPVTVQAGTFEFTPQSSPESP